MWHRQYITQIACYTDSLYCAKWRLMCQRCWFISFISICELCVLVCRPPDRLAYGQGRSQILSVIPYLVFSLPHHTNVIVKAKLIGVKQPVANRLWIDKYSHWPLRGGNIQWYYPPLSATSHHGYQGSHLGQIEMFVGKLPSPFSIAESVDHTLAFLFHLVCLLPWLSILPG